MLEVGKYCCFVEYIYYGKNILKPENNWSRFVWRHLKANWINFWDKNSRIHFIARKTEVGKWICLQSALLGSWLTMNQCSHLIHLSFTIDFYWSVALVEMKWVCSWLEKAAIKNSRSKKHSSNQSFSHTNPFTLSNFVHQFSHQQILVVQPISSPYQWWNVGEDSSLLSKHLGPKKQSQREGC